MKAWIAVSASAAILLEVNVNVAAGLERVAQTFSLTVNATNNIYASAPGIAVQGGDILRFSVPHSATVTVNNGGNWNDADGVGAGANSETNTGSGSLSGIIAPNAGFLVGVFVPAGGPKGSAPPTLDFVTSGTSFASLSPLLDQVFFIGDGLTGNGTGQRQKFRAPSGAAMLYLGLSDACNFHGPPGCFDDNIGSFNVTISGSVAVDQPALTPGIYSVSALITRFNQLSGNYCFPSMPNYFGRVSSFYITHNGAGEAVTATIPVPAIPAFGNSPRAGPFMAVMTLPATPETGNVWNGTSTEVLQPLKARIPPKPFTATLNVTSPSSFAGVMTFNAFSPGVPPDNIGNFCDVTLQYSAALVGAVN